MAPQSLNYAPLAASAAVVLAIVLVLGLNFDVSTPDLIIIILGGLTACLALLTIVLSRRLRKQDQHAWNLRQIAERMQAMLASVPEAYCVFTTQGIMREATRIAQLLGVEKISHFEDLVSAIKDPEDFVAAFRKMQMTGDGFSLSVLSAADNKPIHVAGARMHIGKDAFLLLDIVWFGSNPASTTLIEDKNAELSLSLAKLEKVRTVYDKMPIPMWSRNEDCNIIQCNASYAKALDSTKEDVFRNQQELTSATARAGSGRALAAKALQIGTAQIERRHVIMAGKRNLLEITETPYEANGVKGVFGFAINVTAEEEKEHELDRHAASQKEVLEHLGSAIAIYGPDTRLEFYNRAYSRLWHADEAFLDSKPTFSDVIEDQRTRRVAPEQADFPRYKQERISLFTSLLEPREDLMCLPDGTTLRILVSPHPMGGLIFVHEDVTDKLALESSYNTLIAVQRETLDNLSEGIIVFAPDGKVGLFNPAVEQMWQLPDGFLASTPHISDLIDKTAHLLSFDGDWAEYKKKVIAYSLDRTPRKGRMDLTNGIVLEYVTVPLPDGAVLNSYLDITDSIKAERALRATNMALSAADRLKSEFVANVSYQLRTPINTIMGFSEILTNQYFGSLNDRQMEYTRTIMDASKKLLLLINDVLDLATIEAGRMVLDRESVPVASILNATKHMTAEWARQQSLEIIIDCPTNIGSFEVDARRIKQVLFNLLSNAIKYTPAGGRITLQARAQDDAIAITVSDTGIGIAEADLERVFGKFERANTQSRQSGVGLGLSLVKNFIELHNGKVQISSAPRKGTHVTVTLPIRASATERVETA